MSKYNTGKDLLADWKLSKFVVVESIGPNYAYEIILTDINFWAANIDDAQQWVNDVGGKITGMIAHLPDEEALTAFCLKWR